MSEHYYTQSLVPSSQTTTDMKTTLRGHKLRFKRMLAFFRKQVSISEVVY